MDWCKLENFKWASILYKLRGRTKTTFSEAYRIEADKIANNDEKERFLRFANVFDYTFISSIGPLCAFVGGIVA